MVRLGSGVFEQKSINSNWKISVWNWRQKRNLHLFIFIKNVLMVLLASGFIVNTQHYIDVDWCSVYRAQAFVYPRKLIKANESSRSTEY